MLTALNNQLTQKQSDLEILRTRLGSQNPQVKEAQVAIAQLNEQIEKQTSKVVQTLGTGSQVSQMSLAQARAALATQGSKVLDMKAQRDQARVLESEVANAQKTYDTVISRSTQTQLQTDSAQTNVSVLKRATLPGEASFPRLGLNLLIGTVLGLLLGLPAALVRELRDRRIHTEDDVALGLQLPVLATLPRVTHSGSQQPSAPRSLRIKARVLGLPEPTLQR